MLWFDCTLVDLHSSPLRRNSSLSVPVGGHRCLVMLPSGKKWKCLFSKPKNNSDSLDSKTQVLESRRCPRSSNKSPCTRENIIIRKCRYLPRWCRTYGSDGGSDQLCTLSVKAWYLLDDRLLCTASFSSWLFYSFVAMRHPSPKVHRHHHTATVTFYLYKKKSLFLCFQHISMFS